MHSKAPDADDVPLAVKVAVAVGRLRQSCRATHSAGVTHCPTGAVLLLLVVIAEEFALASVAVGV